MKERQRLDTSINGIRTIERSLADNIELIAMGEEEGDPGIVAEAEAGIRGLQKEVAERQIDTLLSGEVDSNDTYLEVHSGAGGTESQDGTPEILDIAAQSIRALGWTSAAA